jgi:hypothetical protein
VATEREDGRSNESLNPVAATADTATAAMITARRRCTGARGARCAGLCRGTRSGRAEARC